jgi:hypothetical protein
MYKESRINFICTPLKKILAILTAIVGPDMIIVRLLMNIICNNIAKYRLVDMRCV